MTTFDRVTSAAATVAETTQRVIAAKDAEIAALKRELFRSSRRDAAREGRRHVRRLLEVVAAHGSASATPNLEAACDAIASITGWRLTREQVARVLEAGAATQPAEPKTFPVPLPEGPQPGWRVEL